MNSGTATENKVLIITYVFPPAAWVGVHRTLKYCKYLGEHSWTPIVLTAHTKGVTFKDENLLRQLPAHVPVHRTFDIDPAKWEAKLAERKLKHSRPVTTTLAASSRTGPEAGQAKPRSLGLWSRFKELLKALLKDSPDSHVFWVPFAFLKGVGILLRENVDVIYCSSPPHSSHIVAFLLAKCFRKPYILDFRDPWYVRGSVRSPGGKLSWMLQFETFTKRVIVKHAAQVISVSKGERDELRAEFPEISEKHFTFITNGYDPTDISAESVGKKPSGKLTFVHAGTIYPGIAGEFFEALCQLIKSYPGIEERIQVQLLGEIAYEYTEVVRTLEATGILKTYGLQPHAQTLKMVLESDILVILMGGTKYLPSHIPSKVFEYLYAGKPILAIARDGELAELIKQSGLGIVVSPESVARVAQTLWELCAAYAAGQVTKVPNQSYIRSFERAALTAKLAIILDEVKEVHCVRS